MLAAPFVGSVLGVLIRRLPEGRSVTLARSECESCGRTLSLIDLVPIFSFLLLRGNCRTCHAPIARFHLTVELAALGIAIWAASTAPDAPRLWADCGLGWVLLALSWIDARHLALPDVLTLPLIVAGLCVTWWLAPQNILAHALGAIAGYAAFRTIALIYRRLRGQDGLGEGDAKLLAAAGAWIGLAALPRMVFGAALLGIVITLLLRARDGRRPGVPVPFGPALALALFITRLYG